MELKIPKPALWVLVAVIIILLGGGFYFGQRFYQKEAKAPSTLLNPQKVAENFMKDLKDKIVKEDWLKIEDYSKISFGKSEGEYKGFNWLDEKNEIHLIKGVWITYDPKDYSIGDTPPNKEIINGVRGIHSYLLKKGFALNERNKYFHGTEDEFWQSENLGQIAYARSNIKCLLSTPFNFTEDGFTVECGDILISHTPEVYRKIYNGANPDRYLGFKLFIKNVVGNFAIGSSGGPGGGAWSIWKKENGEWESLQSTQMGWSCNTLLDNKVPLSLFEKPQEEECIFYECWECEEKGCPGYEEICKRQEAGEKFIYQELYEEKFGKEK